MERLFTCLILFAFAAPIVAASPVVATPNTAASSTTSPVPASSAAPNTAAPVTLSANGGLFASTVFTCSPLLDGVLLGTGAAIYGTDLVLDKALKINHTKFGGTPLNKSAVNVVDRFLMQPYSKPLDTTADVLVAVALASPLVLGVTETSSEWATLGVMYAETLLLAQGIKEITKVFVNRARPYVYFDGFPTKDVYEDYDWNKSCPSGHSTMAFASATFLGSVFCRSHPQSFWRYPVVIGGYALAGTVAALRVASGNHFLTDVLAGAALGTGIGLLVPWLHTFSAPAGSADATDGATATNAKNSVKVSVTPTGVYCRASF